jgi:hypothetical protein
MKMHKKTSIRGEYAKIGEDIRDGDVITIKDAGTVVSGEYGTTLSKPTEKTAKDG